MHKNVYLRAASPAAMAASMAAVTGSEIKDLVAFTTQNVSTQTSIEGLITTMPSCYRFFIPKELRKMQDVHEKYLKNAIALTKLQKHQNAGTWPDYIKAIGNPFDSYQVTQESKSTILPLLTSNNAWLKDIRAQALQKVIDLKQQEVNVLLKDAAPANVIPKIVKMIEDDYVVLEEQLKAGVMPDSKGKAPLVAPFMSKNKDFAIEMTPIWVAKVWEFCRITTLRAEEKQKRKEALEEDAPEPMEVDQTTLQKMVDLAVSKREKEKAPKKANKPTPRQQNKVSELNTHYYAITQANSSSGKRKPEEELCSGKTKRACPTSSNRWETSRNWEKAAESCFQPKVRPSAKEEEIIDYVMSRKWCPTKPSSMPQEILELDTDTAHMLIQSRRPLTLVRTEDMKVKLGPGVTSIPKNIDDILNLGQRFLFPKAFSLELPLESYMSLARRIKWQVYYYYLNQPTSFLDVYKQFRLPKQETDAVPDTIPLWVSKMLEKGRLELVSQLQAIPSTAVNATVDPKYKRDLTTLRDWRKKNNFLVLQADKNLGTTVVSSEWYLQKLDDLVLNNSDFVEISEYNYVDMINRARNEIRTFENSTLPYEVREYILVNCTTQSTGNNLPKFHGLPKVHKKPWALRPIVPCHSYPLTNASKVLSELLKPYVRSSPWILESTQDLAKLIVDKELPQSEKYWLCTGDVTAMYPNIPRERAHTILCETIAQTVDSDATLELIKHLLKWSDNYLAFRHHNKIFYQKDGLAMGIPAAPDVANLYMAYFEDSFAGRFPLYKRYIDDVFVLVKAPTRKDALEQLAVIQADGLELTWSVDEETINFLDLCITQEAGYLSFKPYRKPLNSYERLPWSSSHPRHVKRAAFCGEISRIARLCSRYKPTYYNEVSYVRDIYASRGYPSELLHSWIKQEARNRWVTRYKDTPEASGEDALWLKSEYNSVWQHIDTHKVWAAMMKDRIGKPLPLSHIESIRLSLKRYRNLGEINNKYNADTLRGSLVEENDRLLEQDVEPIRPPIETDRPQLMRYGRWDNQWKINWGAPIGTRNSP